jgi:hypothetical protein
VGLKSLKSLNLTNGYPNKNKKNKNKNNNKVKSKPLELFELAGKNCSAEKYLFCFAGSVLFSLLFVYYFCTIFVIHQKNWQRYHPLCSDLSQLLFILHVNYSTILKRAVKKHMSKLALRK